MSFFNQKVGEAENKHTQSEKQNVISLDVFLVACIYLWYTQNVEVLACHCRVL